MKSKIIEIFFSNLYTYSKLSKQYGATEGGHGAYDQEADQFGEELYLDFVKDQLTRSGVDKSQIPSLANNRLSDTFQRRLGENNKFWQMEKDRVAEGEVIYELELDVRDGQMHLYNRENDIFLVDMFKNYEKYLAQKNELDKYNYKEANAVMEMDSLISAGGISSAIYAVSHESKSVRYINQFTQTPDGKYKAQYIDVGQYVRDLTEDEANSVLNTLGTIAGDVSLTYSENGKYPYLISRDKTFTVSEVREAVLGKIIDVDGVAKVEDGLQKWRNLQDIKEGQSPDKLISPHDIVPPFHGIIESLDYVGNQMVTDTTNTLHDMGTFLQAHLFDLAYSHKVDTENSSIKQKLKNAFGIKSSVSPPVAEMLESIHENKPSAPEYIDVEANEVNIPNTQIIELQKDIINILPVFVKTDIPIVVLKVLAQEVITPENTEKISNLEQVPLKIDPSDENFKQVSINTIDSNYELSTSRNGDSLVVALENPIDVKSITDFTESLDDLDIEALTNIISFFIEKTKTFTNDEYDNFTNLAILFILVSYVKQKISNNSENLDNLLEEPVLNLEKVTVNAPEESQFMSTYESSNIIKEEDFELHILKQIFELNAVLLFLFIISGSKKQELTLPQSMSDIQKNYSSLEKNTNNSSENPILNILIERPWILLSIIWHLNMIREMGLAQNNQLQKKTKNKKKKTKFPKFGVIYINLDHDTMHI